MSKISKRKESSSADNESELLECFEPKVKLIVAAFLCQSHPKRIKIDDDPPTVYNVGRLLQIAPRTISDALPKAASQGLTSLLFRKKPAVLPFHMRPLLDDSMCDFILNKYTDEPRYYLDEIQRFLFDEKQLKVSLPNIANALNKRLFLTRKNASKLRGIPSADSVDDFLFQIRDVPREYVVAYDEATSDRLGQQRSMGRSPKGIPVPVSGSIIIRGTRISVMAAINCDGIVAFRDQVGGTLTGVEVLDFLEQDLIPQMNPYPGPRSVLILDNAKVHHTSAVQAAAEQAGILLVYLPPYSPMLNPVEFMFHEMKSFLRRHSLSLSPNYDHQQLLRLSLDYVQHHGYCANYMRHCGY